MKKNLFRLISAIAILVSLTGTASLANPTPALAGTNLMTLRVESAANASTEVTQYHYLINIDNTGTTEQRDPNDPLHPGCSPSDPGYPGSCNWVSVAGEKSNSPIFTQGTQDDFAGGAGINFPASCTDAAPCRYLISVLADGYKIDGAHFSVPFAGDGLVIVQMQPYDLPDATIQAEVFEDSAPTNSAPDVPAERGIAGFVGHIKDYIDEVTTDVYGDPLCGNSRCLSKCYVVDAGIDVGIVDPIDADGRCPFRAELPANATTVDTNLPISEDAIIQGKLIIPNLGPNRYALSVVPPDGSGWVQTTTLEGNHDWDAWVMEGATGLDTEFVVAGEPFPATFFGYIKEGRSMAAGSGTILGTALAVSAYIPPTGGITGEAGLLGAKPKDKNPIHSLYVSLSDLNRNDQTVYMGHFTCDEAAGCPPIPFTISNVPDGDYVLGVWDEPQDYIFLEQNVSIVNGETADLGSLSLLGWWTTIEGHVFNDLNENGKMDAGEPGIPNFPIGMRTRANSLMDRGTTAVTTDANGYYWMESAYPMTQWLIEEAYADGFQTTGITYQADNQPEETTILGQGVDVNVHPVIGLGGRLDWGVKAYAPGTNGGIVGTVSYDTTRNELDARYAAIEDWQPSISGLKVNLYMPVPCPGDGSLPCDPLGMYALASDGAYMKGALVNQYVTETWERPTGCVARNVDGNPLAHGTDEQVLPLNSDAECVEAPMMGVQFGPMSDGSNFGASVDGNYGFGDYCAAGVLLDGNGGVVWGADGAPVCSDGADHIAMPSNSDYLVSVQLPTEADVFGADAAHPDRPIYQVTREEDINIANGDSFVPQVPPSACAGPLHTVDVLSSGMDNYPQQDGMGYDINGLPNGVIVAASSPVDNPTLAYDLQGTIYEGRPMPLCDTKLVHLSDRKSIAPGFNLFTDVPLPGRFWGLLVDDLNFSSNPKSTAYGEKLGIPFAPVGIYDYTNRLIYTVESDYNGLFDVLLPSTNRISCPTPSGVCANLYRFVGNDPGTAGHWNANYTQQYRTIAAEFEAFPGLIVPADLAPTPVSVAVQIPGTQTLAPITCSLNDMTGQNPVTDPEFFAITKPYIRTNDSGAARTFTIYGLGFGSTAGSVKLDNFTMALAANGWTNTSITFRVPNSGSNSPSVGSHQLKITTAGGKSTVNALTFHVLNPVQSNGAYNPRVFEVGVGKKYDPTDPARNVGDPANGIGPYEHALQDALNDAANLPAGTKALVVVYPGPVDATNPRYNGRGAYYENIIIHSPVRLQGVGPGGVYPAGMGLAPVQGSIIDGIGFGGDTNAALAWRELAFGLPVAGNQDISEGQVMYVLPATATQFGRANAKNFNAMIDGFDIRGGDQMGFPGNLNAIFGGFPGPVAAANVETQGGAIFANSFASYLKISNNIIEHNGGTYGAIRIGTPNIDPDLNSNDHVLITNNRITDNGGTNLAGSIGLFGGSTAYEVKNNDLCGNFSAEYGGAISHFGLSGGGKIHDNRIYFNRSYDEGAGIMIAGELATDPGALYGAAGGPQGSGAVDIYNNQIVANLSDDDGGGLRFLMVGNYPMNVLNNMIANNVSTHEGGGVALDDAPNVRFFNNTVMKNITTATSLLSDGQPAPAGLSTGANSAQLQPTLPGGSPTFSNPLMFNNIFWDNRAGTRGANMVTGIGAAGDPSLINNWDIGVNGAAGLLSTTSSILQSANGAIPSASNSQSNPLVVRPTDIALSFTSWRTNVNFIGAIMVTADLRPSLFGNYHLTSNSPAINMGAASKTIPTYQRVPLTVTTLLAPAQDIDLQNRPAGRRYDAGADEYVP